MTFSEVFIWLINLSLIAGLAYVIYDRITDENIRRIYVPALGLKVICGIALGYIYFFHFGYGDTIVFYERALNLLNQPLSDWLTDVFLTSIPYDQRSLLPMVKITSVILFITGSSYWLATIWFSLFSFFGGLFLVVQLVRVFPEKGVSISLAILFFPSITFWSSGVLKESIGFGLIMVLSGLFIRYYYYNKGGTWTIVATYACGWLLLILKYYIAAVFLPILIFLYLLAFVEKSQLTQKLNKIYLRAGLVLVFLGLFFWASQLQYNLNPQRILSVLKWNQTQFVGDGAISYFDDLESPLLIVPNLLIAALSGLFRPIFPEMLTFPQVMTAVENLFIVLLFVTGLKQTAQLKRPNMMVLMAGLYVIIMATFLAYAVPNFGTLTRLKVYYMPYFLLLVLWNHPVQDRISKWSKFSS